MALVEYALQDDVAVLTLSRPEKHNALNDAMIAELAVAVDRASSEAKVGIICATGRNFCAGLDLAEYSGKNLIEGVASSRSWHGVFSRIQRGAIPFVAALKGGVIGGGFELAASAHIRVAEPDTYFAMPEGKRGIFVGGSGSVSITRLIGVNRMTDMMLTGRTFNAEEAERYGAVNYISPAGGGLERAAEVARAIAGNAPFSNYVTVNALQRIHDSGYDEGLFFESMIATLSQMTPDAIEGLRAFIEKRAPPLKSPSGGPKDK